MRNWFTVIFVLVVLLTSCAVASAANTSWPGTVKGYGLTAEMARKDAVKEAVRQVKEYIRQLSPPLEHWQVTEEFVENNLVATGGPGPDWMINEQEKEKKGKSWILQMKQPDLELFARLDRQAFGAKQQVERQVISQDRLQLTGWIFGGVLALLLLVMAFLQLKDNSAK